MPFDHSTVEATEEVLERTLEGKTVPLPRTADISGPVVFTGVRDFTCPACNETLTEAVATNGRVRGWCGNKHIPVNVEI